MRTAAVSQCVRAEHVVRVVSAIDQVELTTKQCSLLWRHDRVAIRRRVGGAGPHIDGARRGVTEPDGFDHLAGGQDLPVGLRTVCTLTNGPWLG